MKPHLQKTYVGVASEIVAALSELSGAEVAEVYNQLCRNKVKYSEKYDHFDTIEVDIDENCVYCGQKCWEGEMCDEQQAGGFKK